MATSKDFEVDPKTGRLVSGLKQRIKEQISPSAALERAIVSGEAARLPAFLLAPLEAMAGAERLVTGAIEGAPAALDPAIATYGTAAQAEAAEQRMQQRSTQEGLTRPIPTPPQVPTEIRQRMEQARAEAMGAPTPAPVKTSTEPATSPIRAVRMPNGKIVFTNRPEARGDEVGMEQATAETRRAIAAGPEAQVDPAFAPDAQIRQQADLVNAARESAATGRPGAFVQAAALPGTPAGEEALLRDLGVRAKVAQLKAAESIAGEQTRQASLPPEERIKEAGQEKLSPAIALGLPQMMERARTAAREQAIQHLRATRAKEFSENPAQFEAAIQAQEARAVQEIMQQIIALGPGAGRAPQQSVS